MQGTHPADPLDPYLAAHRRSIHHRADIERSTKCGCFYCLVEFAPSRITEWVDGNTTALCPSCGIDSVLGDASDVPVTRAFLVGMKARWFDETEDGTPIER